MAKQSAISHFTGMCTDVCAKLGLSNVDVEASAVLRGHFFNRYRLKRNVV